MWNGSLLPETPVLSSLAALPSKGHWPSCVHTYTPQPCSAYSYFKTNIQKRRETFSALPIALETRKNGGGLRQWRGGRNAREGLACLRHHHERIFSFETMFLVCQAGLELAIGFCSWLPLLSFLPVRFIVLVRYL